MCYNEITSTALNKSIGLIQRFKYPFNFLSLSKLPSSYNLNINLSTVKRGYINKRILKSLVNFICLSSALLLTTTINLANAALTTANTIQGTAPYLTFDGGQSTATNMDELLSITLSDGTVSTKLSNTSTKLNPIELPAANETFSDITTSIPAGLTVVNLSTLIVGSHNRWIDDDGYGQGRLV